MQLSERVQSWARGVAIALVVATLLIVSLLTPPAPGDWQGVKQLCFIVLTLGLLGVALCQMDPARGAGRWRRVLAEPALPALMLVALAALSWWTSTAKAYGGAEFLRLVGGVGLFFAVAAFFRGRYRLQLLTDVLVGVVILTTLLGFVNYQAMSAGGLGITSSFGNRQLFAGFLVLMAPLMLALSFAELSPGRRIAAQSAAVLACAGLLLAQTRSAWIGLLVGLVVLAALSAWTRERGRSGSGNRRAVLVPLVLLVAATGLFLILSRTAPQIGDRAATLTALDRDASWNERLIAWKGALAMIRERPLTGWGIGAYPVAQAGFVPTSLPAPIVEARGPSLLEMAHNEYLQLTAEIGVPGLLAYLALLVTFLATMLKALRTRGAGLARVILIGVTAGVCAQMVDAISNPAWRYADVSAFFWALMGLGMAAATKRSEETAEALCRASSRPTWSLARLGWQGAVVLLVAFMGAKTVAVAQNPRAMQVPEYVRPRSAFVRPQFVNLLPGQSFQYSLLVFFSNGQHVLLTGPVNGLSWVVSERRGGPPTNAVQELGAGTGHFLALNTPQGIGKTYFVRGIYQQGGALAGGRIRQSFPAVAGVGRLKIAVPFGRVQGLRRR